MYEKIINEKNKVIIALTLIICGVISRLTLFELLPRTPDIYIHINGLTQPMFMLDLFFIIAVISIISGIILGGYYTFVIPFIVMMITDLILGNTLILLFTWSGFILLGVIGFILKSKRSLTFKNIPTFLGAGIGGVILYDIWTNFGCWLGLYPHNFNGLIMCFTVSIPFTLWHLLSTSILLTAVLIPVIVLKNSSLLKTEHTIKPVKKSTAIGATIGLMALSIITLIA